MSAGNFPESLSQTILAGIILVGRLGVGRGRGHRGDRDMLVADKWGQR